MDLNESINKYLKKFKNDPEFIAEGLIIDITENITRILAEKNIDRTELAKRIRTSKAYITKLLRGNTNMTILTMAKIAVALDVEIEAPVLKEHENVWKYRSWSEFVSDAQVSSAMVTVSGTGSAIAEPLREKYDSSKINKGDLEDAVPIFTHAA